MGRSTESNGGSLLDLVRGHVSPVSRICSRFLTTATTVGLPLVQFCLLLFQLNLAGILKSFYKIRRKHQGYTLNALTHDPNILAAEPQTILAAKACVPNSFPFQLLTLALGGLSMMDSGWHHGQTGGLSSSLDSFSAALSGHVWDRSLIP